jgi:hypothetical protein
MSIQDRDEAADREFAKSSASQNSTNLNDEISLPTDNEAKDLAERNRTAEVTLEDKSKDLKNNLMPSFQEMKTPNTTLATTSTKVEELKVSSVAIAEQTIVRREDSLDRGSSTSQS